MSSDKMESVPQSSASSDGDVHVCVICGDTATAYKYTTLQYMKCGHKIL